MNSGSQALKALVRICNSMQWLAAGSCWVEVLIWIELCIKLTLDPVEETRLQVGKIGHLMWKACSLEKTLMLEKMEGRRRMGPQRIRLLDSITDSMDRDLSKLWDTEGQRRLACCSSWGLQSQTRLGYWKDRIRYINLETFQLRKAMMVAWARLVAVLML